MDKNNSGPQENPNRFDHLLKPSKTREQVAEEYSIDPITLKRRLKKKGLELPSGLLLREQQIMIYQALGAPR
jgi:hypothetical protein